MLAFESGAVIGEMVRGSNCFEQLKQGGLGGYHHVVPDSSRAEESGGSRWAGRVEIYWDV